MRLDRLLRRHGVLRRRWLLAEVLMPPASLRGGRIRPKRVRQPLAMALPVRQPPSPEESRG